jgi:group II intron reverse transcriptase/maturase
MNEELKTKTKYVPVTKTMVWEAYKKVKHNKGGAGIDNIKLDEFDKDYQKYLYKIWNRLSSGSYFPPSVKEVEIPKSDGKKRKLGIPTIGDRIAQMVVKDYLEPVFEKIFHENSYGYRSGKSAHQALERVRVNCWKYDWIIDLDIKGFFDNIDHELLMKAIDKHTDEKWVKMYIGRWLEAPVEKQDGSKVFKQGKGTPQGGVISPLLANLFLHYSLDIWLTKYYPTCPFVRYADDMIIHCQTREEANFILIKVRERLNQCKLELSEAKTKIVYCRDYKRQDNEENVKFDFLGFSFQPRTTKSKINGKPFLGFDCAISKKARTKIIAVIRGLNIHRMSEGSIDEIAAILNPKLSGWINYYGKFRGKELDKLFRVMTYRLMKWVQNKYKIISRGLAFDWLKGKLKATPQSIRTLESRIHIHLIE